MKCYYLNVYFQGQVVKTDVPCQRTEAGLKYMCVETEHSSNGEGKIVPMQI